MLIAQHKGCAAVDRAIAHRAAFGWIEIGAERRDHVEVKLTGWEAAADRPSVLLARQAEGQGAIGCNQGIGQDIAVEWKLDAERNFFLASVVIQLNRSSIG